MENQRRRAAALATAMSLCFTPLAALAAKPEPKTRVAVMPLVVDGDVPGDVRAEALDRIKVALESRDYEVVEGRPAGAHCTDYKCIRSVADDSDAQWVVQPALSTVVHDYGIAVRLYDAAGTLKVDESSTCEICSYPDAIEALVTEAAEVREPLIRYVDNPYADREAAEFEDDDISRLAIRTEPPGALVRLDGERIGKTPVEIDVEPGLRDLQITLRHHNDIVQTVRAPRGGSELLTYTMVENDERQTRALRITAWTFSMVGVALIGAGVPLLALEERPVRNQCSGNDVDFNGRCRYRYDTLLPGALLTGFGMASLVTGITTGVIAAVRKGRQSKPKGVLDTMDEDTISSRPVVRPVLGPTSAGVRVRF